MKKAEMYNKKPTEMLKNAIIKLMTPAETKAKEETDKLKAKSKGLKQQVKKETRKGGDKKVAKEKFDLLDALDKALTEDATAVDKFQKLLDKFKKVEEAVPIAVSTPTPRKGENYRNN